MVCRRGQTAIRPAAQNQRHLVVLRQLIGYIVGRFDPRHPGMVVVKFPSRQPAVGRDAAFDFDHTRGAEVCPGELLFACPNNFYGLSRRARQSCGLHSRVAGMLPSVGCPRVGNDDPNVALRHMKNARQFVAIRKRRSDEHTSELQSRLHLVCRLLLEKKKPPRANATAETGLPAGCTRVSRITNSAFGSPAPGRAPGARSAAATTSPTATRGSVQHDT